jgi:hypothetical protein
MLRVRIGQSPSLLESRDLIFYNLIWFAFLCLRTDKWAEGVGHGYERREEETRRSHDANPACSPRLLRLWLDMSIASPQPVVKSPPLEKKDPGKSSLFLHASAY